MPAAQAPTSALAPGLLVAAPALTDPNFAGSIVLMAEHHGEGALGFVLNRTAPLDVKELLGGVDADLRAAAEAAGRADGPVLVGGPVQPERLWILFRPEPDRALPEGEVVQVGDDLALGGSRELLESLVRAPGEAFQLLLGYAGWAPMQAEKEVASGAWVPMPVASDLLFEVPLEKRWETAVRRLGLDPGEFLVGGGGAQA
jgi:putative transcriptional regulator